MSYSSTAVLDFMIRRKNLNIFWVNIVILYGLALIVTRFVFQNINPVLNFKKHLFVFKQINESELCL